MNMYLTQVIKTSILVPGKSSKHNILTGEKKKWFQVVITALCYQHWSVMPQSLSVVIELFHQTLGVLSQDGFLRFIDIHACKQLFEIGGADEVLYPNEKVLICSPFLFFFHIIFSFFLDLACFSFTFVVLYYFYERELLSFIHFTHR